MAHSDQDEDGFLPRDGRFERIVYMIVFLVLVSAAGNLLGLMAFGQMIWTLVTGQPNDHIAEFGARLGVWTKRVVLYLSGTTDEKPFPWREID